MSVYKRGLTYWFKFRFQGQLIRESAKTNSKTVAREAERARRREIELAVNRIPRRERMPLFSVAAREWLASRVGLAANTLETYEHFVETLTEQFESGSSATLTIKTFRRFNASDWGKINQRGR